jgi:hypothetical protein
VIHRARVFIPSLSCPRKCAEHTYLTGSTSRQASFTCRISWVVEMVEAIVEEINDEIEDEINEVSLHERRREEAPGR